MKRHIIAAAIVVGAVPVMAQQGATAPAAPDSEVVAVVNGETITRATLDQHWNRIGVQMRQQYETSGGGKFGFLENYVSKRLMLQHAAQSGFDRKPDVQAELEAARESALFDLYVRDVIAASVITEQDMRKLYDENRAEFTQPEQAKVRVISLDRSRRPVEEARDLMLQTWSELSTARSRVTAAGGPVEDMTELFAQVARAKSEHESAAIGGDLGWVTPDKLDPRLAQAAFSLQPGTISDVIDTLRGPFIVYVEERKAAEVEPYESARASIREYLLSAKSQQVVEELNKTTRQLRSTGKVTIYKDNVE